MCMLGQYGKKQTHDDHFHLYRNPVFPESKFHLSHAEHIPSVSRVIHWETDYHVHMCTSLQFPMLLPLCLSRHPQAQAVMGNGFLKSHKVISESGSKDNSTENNIFSIDLSSASQRTGSITCMCVFQYSKQESSNLCTPLEALSSYHPPDTQLPFGGLLQ